MSRILALVLVVALQEPGAIWRGVYTAEQADRGREMYTRRCARCHGADLAGRRDYPLAGEGFMNHWEAHTLEHLFRLMRDSMPPDDIAGVSDADKRDVLAYLLQQNGFPPGPNELPVTDGDLAAVQIVRQNGPGPLTIGALVGATGCLEAQSDRGWALTRATEPQRTTLDAPKAAAGMGSRPTPDAGTRTIRLLNVFPTPDAHAGHTMRAIGFFVKTDGGDAVNVVSLELIAPTCAR